jgi:hypothetical protein
VENGHVDLPLPPGVVKLFLNFQINFELMFEFYLASNQRPFFAGARWHAPEELAAAKNQSQEL